MIQLPDDIIVHDYSHETKHMGYFINKEDIPKIKKWLVEYEMNKKEEDKIGWTGMRGML